MCGLRATMGSQSRASNPTLEAAYGHSRGRLGRWGSAVQRDSTRVDPAGGDTEMGPMRFRVEEKGVKERLGAAREVRGGVTEAKGWKRIRKEGPRISRAGPEAGGRETGMGAGHLAASTVRALGRCFRGLQMRSPSACVDNLSRSSVKEREEGEYSRERNLG